MSQRPVRVGFTRRGVVFLVASLLASVFAYSMGLRELLYVAILLVALPVGALALVWLARPRLSVTRTFSPHILEAGAAASVTMHVRNLAYRRSTRSRWRDTLPWRPGRTPDADLPALQPRGARFSARGNSAELRYELRPPRRGVFSIGPLGVDVTDAFGLASSSLTTGQPQPIVVTPVVVALPATGLSTTAGDGESRLVQRRSSGDEDDTITREYRSGDAMRRVHWRATARHGDLMVRQEEQRSLPEARIIVDTRRDGYRDASGEGDDADGAESESFEWVVRMLGSVAVHLRRSGFLVHVVETGPPQLASLGRKGRRAWGEEELLVGLASFGLVDDREHAEPRTRRGGPTIAIVGSPDAATVDWLAGQGREGDVSVVFMVQNVSSVDVINRSFGVDRAPSQVGERLADAGWLVVPVRADDDHATAWEAVVFETGRSRAGT
ncbi:DUF58 domain-containing protein [soil metagenome]